MIEAHGTKFETVAAANARIAELNTINLEIGASDGRVTEIMCIMDALAAAPAKPAKPVIGELTMQFIIEAQGQLASIKRSGYDDGKWRYLKVVTPEGRMTRREYRTQKGFLTAYIREALRGSDILIAE